MLFEPPAIVQVSPSLAADEAELRRLKIVEWPRVYREQDVAGLDALLHPEFQVFSGDTVSTKAEELAWVRANPWRHEDFTYTITLLLVLGDAAIVNGEGVMRSGRGAEAHQMRYRSSNMFVRVDGRWQAISSHVGPSIREPLT